MTTISITNAYTQIALTQDFSITLTEPTCPNCQWEVHFPHGLILTDVEKFTNNSQPSTRWTLRPSIAGTYILDFRYRKRCCGKPVLKQESYTIVIY